MGTITQAIANNLTTGLGGAGGVNFRNIIINGDMSIAQRGTSVTGITGSGYNTVDRFKNTMASSGTWTQSQSTDVPTGQGFATSLKMDCTTADASPDYLIINSAIEGQNLQYLKYGTASSESVTLSFWVKSNKTGTYIAELDDTDNSSKYSKSYTIDSASTWEKKTLTFPPKTSGSLDNDNARSLDLVFWLGAGSSYSGGSSLNEWTNNTNERAVGQVNLADSIANEWYVTGVQLEAGTSASDFEFLPYDINLRRCERYCLVINSNNYAALCNGYYNTTTEVRGGFITFPTTMRASPTITPSGTASNYNIARPGTSNASGSGLPTATQISTNSYELLITSNSSSTAGYGTRILALSDAAIKIEAEL